MIVNLERKPNPVGNTELKREEKCSISEWSLTPHLDFIEQCEVCRHKHLAVIPKTLTPSHKNTLSVCVLKGKYLTWLWVKVLSPFTGFINQQQIQIHDFSPNSHVDKQMLLLFVFIFKRQVKSCLIGFFFYLSVASWVWWMSIGHQCQW